MAEIARNIAVNIIKSLKDLNRRIYFRRFLFVVGCWGMVLGELLGQPTCSVQTQVNVSCYGESTGSITINVSGGTLPYTFLWSNGTTTQNITNLSVGTYSVRITDADNIPCELNDIIITQPTAALTIVASSDSPICSGASVNLTSIPSGGTPIYSYSWTGPNGFTSILQNPSVLNATTNALGTYTVVITDANGCINTANTDVTVNPLLVPSVTITANPGISICNGTSVTFTANPTNGGTTPVYQWRVNGTNQGNSSSIFTYSPANNDQVTVTLTSSETCTSGNPAISNPVNMTVNPVLIPSVTLSANPGLTICSGASVTLTATPVNGGTSPSYQWQLNGLNQGSNSTNNSHTFNNLLNGSIVKVILSSNATPCLSAQTVDATATITVTQIPTITSVTSGTICASGTTGLSATATAGTISWYSSSTGGSSLGTGTSFTTPVISSTTTYYVDATDNGCSTASRTAVTATVNQPPSIISTTPGSTCGSGTVMLGATSSAGIINWYSDATGGSSIGTGTSFTTSVISSTTTYYVDATANGCTAGTRTPVVATVNALPTILTVTPGSVCGSGSVMLSATASAGTIDWYSDLTEGTSLGTGPNFTTPVISSSTTYYADATDNGCTSSARTPVIATVNTVPSITGTTPGNVCTSGTVNLGASASAGIINWYDAATGGSVLGTGTSYITPVISTTATYYVDATANGCTTASRTAIVATVTPVPTITSSTPGSVCGTGTVILQATASAGIINWYSAPTGGILLGSGTSFTTPVISSTTTYYAEAINNGCSSTPRTPVTATVNPVPTITSTTPGSRCGTGTVTLGAIASGGTINWYSAPTGGLSLVTGTSFTTPGISSTTTYYVDATLNGCTTATRTAVVATVNANVTPSVSITATATSICLGTSVTFTATPTNGGTSPTYQWRRNGANIPGATGSTYTTTSLTNPSTITVVMTSNATCASPLTAASNSIVMTIFNSAPSFSNGNQGRINGPGSVCPGPLAVNLEYRAQNNINATLYTWTLPPGFEITSGAGTYDIFVRVLGPGAINLNNQIISVVASNPCGSDTKTFNVNVGSFAGVDAGKDFPMCSGTTANLTNILSGNAASVIWTAPSGTINGGPYPAIFDYTPSILSGNVTLTVTTNTAFGNCPASVGTDQVVVTVYQAPSITTQPVSQTLCSGNNATFSVTASGSGLTYQWQKGGTDIPGATSSTFTINNVNVSDAGTYTVIVGGTAPCTPVTSLPAILAVNQAVNITTQPASQTLCTGNNATFSVVATGTGLTYQWQKGGASIPGATLSTYTNNNITASDAGNYTVIISGTSPCAPVTSSIATLTVNQGINITTQPASQILCSGNNAVFNIVATGSGLSYQWQKGGTNITGATTSSYTLNNIALSDAGNYTVIVSGAAPCSPVTSSTATLTVNQAVVITTQPVSQTLCTGNTATFNVVATGTGLSYQWQKGGFDIPGATSASYTINNITTADAGNYIVIVRGTAPCSPVTSSTVTLSVNQAVSITTQPSSQSLCSGNNLVLSVVATGDGLTYQWRKNGTNISGATTNSLSINNISTSDAGSYDVIVSGTSPCSPVTSTTALINVNESAAITTQPLPTQSICASFPVTFSVSATGTGLTYQWYKDGITIPQTVSAFTILHTALSDAGTYRVVVSSPGCNSVTSENSVLTVTREIDITTQPASQNECVGSTVSFTVVATGSISGYVWRRNGIPVSGSNYSGETTSTLTITNVSGINAGAFDVIVNSTGGTCDQAISEDAILTVNTNPTITLTSPLATTGQTVCEGVAIASVTYQFGGNYTGGSVSGLPAGINGVFNGTTGVFTISGSSSVTGAFPYTVTATGPCGTATATGSITINANSTITLTSGAGTNNQTVCTGTPITPITFSIGGGGNGATLTGILPSGVTGSYSAGIFTVSGTPTAAGTFNFTVTTTGPCTNNSSNGSIIVNDNSTIALTSTAGTENQTRCINNAITNITYSAGGGSTGASITPGSLPAGVNGTFSAGVFTISGTPTASGSFPYTVTATGPCNNVSASGTITVTANSTISLTSAPSTSNQTICEGLTISNIEYTIGGGGTGALITGGSLPAGVTGSYSAGIFTISGTPTAIGTFPYTITTSGPCINASASGTITVNPNSTITLSSGSADQQLCQNSAITNIVFTVGGGASGATATGLPGGLTGTYNAGNKTFTIAGTATSSGIFNYTVTTTGQCASASTGGTITVYSTPVGGIISPASQVICQGGTPTVLTLTGYNGSIVRWESSNNGGSSWTTIANTSDTYNPGGGQTSIYRAVVSSGNCPVVYSTSAVISVVAPYVPTITTVPSPSTICAGESVTLTASSGNLDGAFTNGGFNSSNPTGWLTDGSPNGFNASPNNGNEGIWGRSNGNTYGGIPYSSSQGAFAVVNGNLNSRLETPVFSLIGLPSAYLDILQAIHLTAGATVYIEISTDGGTSYNNVLAQYSGPIDVGNPNGLTSFNYPLTAYLGQGNLRIRFRFTGSTGSGWAVDNVTVPAVPGGGSYPNPITYQWSPLTGLNPANGIGASVTATPAVTTQYTVTSSINGCPLGIASVTVTVNPLPVVSAAPSSQTICSGTTTSIGLSSTVTGTTYTWTASIITPPAGGTISGFGNCAAACGTTIAQTLTNSGTTAGVVRYVITPRANGCPGATINVDITVNPRTIVTAAPPTQSICTGNTTSIALSASVTGTTYSWTTSVLTPPSGGTITGFGDCASSCGNNIAQTLTNSGTTAGVVRYIVTPSANTCAGTPVNVDVTVNPRPQVVATPSPSVICSGSTTSIALSSNVSGTTYTWTASILTPPSGGTINGLGNCAATCGASIAQILTNTGTTAGVVRYTVTPSANGCTGNPINIDVTVNPLPVPTISGPTSICMNMNGNIYTTQSGMTNYNWSVSAGGSITAGGTPGSNTVTVTWNASGAQTVSVNFHDPNGCTATAPVVYNVNVINCITCPPEQRVCPGTDFIFNTIAEFTAAGGIVSFPCTASTITRLSSTVVQTLSPCGDVLQQTYELTDVCGNHMTCNVMVRRIDQISPTISGCPANQTFCDVSGHTFAIPVLTGIIDNCPGSLTVVFDITGATLRSGTGYDASGTFNTGTSTIRWTVTDACGNSSICDTQVIINELPATSLIYHR